MAACVLGQAQDCKTLQESLCLLKKRQSMLGIFGAHEELTDDDDATDDELTDDDEYLEANELTQMLAGNPQTQRLYQIFAGVPRKAPPMFSKPSSGTKAETPPIESMSCSGGIDFYIKVFLTGLMGLAAGYLLMCGFSFVIALINMTTGSCGQETWKSPASEACQKMLLSTLLFSLDIRCFGDKPEALTQSEFDEACSGKSQSVSSMIIGILIAIAVAITLVSRLPVKANFHNDFFTVESWSGIKFYASFYADVTGAQVSTSGLAITTRAKAKLNAGGAGDDEDEDEKECEKCCVKYCPTCCGCEEEKCITMKIKGDSVIKMLAGSGKQKKKLLDTFAKYLPVSIDGFEGKVMPSKSSASLLDGRVQQILDARTADSSKFKAVRRPFTGEFISDLAITALIALICMYAFTRIFAYIEWATKKGANHCSDPMRPGADMCATWRIFTPINVPLVNASDYISLVMSILAFVGVPLYYVLITPMEYRFHSNGAMQEVPLAGWESQENKVFFPEEVQSFEEDDGMWEKKVKMKAGAVYIIKNGVTKPFYLTACIKREQHNLNFADATCAACCGQRQQAVAHKEALMSSLNEFRPGVFV